MNAKQQTMIVLVALSLPLVCAAESPVTRTAVRNCAHAEAKMLNTGKVVTQYQSGSGLAPIPDFARVSNQMIVTARNPDGVREAQMVCTYNGKGRIVSIRPISPLDDMPTIGSSSWQ
jgi:hypothetical protein